MGLGFLVGRMVWGYAFLVENRFLKDIFFLTYDTQMKSGLLSYSVEKILIGYTDFFMYIYDS